MYYYKFKNKILFSLQLYSEFEETTEYDASLIKDTIYFLNKFDPLYSRKSFAITDSSLLFLENEGLHLLKKDPKEHTIPKWIETKIIEKKVISINTSYPNWQECLKCTIPPKWRLHIIGMGDVGGTLTTGLRLLGGDYISEVGIYGTNTNQLKRWDFEINQIFSIDSNTNFPDIRIISEQEIFDCDMFVFCASVGVPKVGSNVKDVRIAQLEGNSKIIKLYAKMAREKNFKGIFAVVSDPVDLLCKVAFLESNTDKNENIDFEGLSAEQIRGYGLGVMHARAVYYSKQNDKTKDYIDEGRAFGPHGKELVIANNISNYDEDLSLYLTNKTITANLEVRATGFKPYIAPALSSGALSIINTISGKWHYSTTYMGGAFMGAKNRLIHTGTEIERLDLPTSLYQRLEDCHRNLVNTI
ncbi:lactate dehydrogenase [Lutibacter sp. B2]|nr:lactate dehydrogenase [Lutibacter sp. B2]